MPKQRIINKEFKERALNFYIKYLDYQKELKTKKRALRKKAQENKVKSK